MFRTVFYNLVNQNLFKGKLSKEEMKNYVYTFFDEKKLNYEYFEENGLLIYAGNIIFYGKKEPIIEQALKELRKKYDDMFMWWEASISSRYTNKLLPGGYIINNFETLNITLNKSFIQIYKLKKKKIKIKIEFKIYIYYYFKIYLRYKV